MGRSNLSDRASAAALTWTDGALSTAKGEILGRFDEAQCAAVLDVIDELELTTAFDSLLSTYNTAREAGRPVRRAPDEDLADFIADQAYGALQDARVLMAKMAVREAARRAGERAEEEAEDAADAARAAA